jgi:hypothetical protein
MIVPRYRIAPSPIPGAGRGVLLDEPVRRGQVLIAPDRIDRMIRRGELDRLPAASIEHQSSARWFEDWHTLSPDWPDDCYVNHSSDPTGIWHLGFVFAARDLPAGAEITIDYRFVIGDGEVAAFVCSASGERVVGLPWRDNLRQSAQRVLELLSS